MRARIVIASICLSVAGCGPSNKIEPIYISADQYQSLSCDEIAGEAQRVARSAAAVAGAPDSNAEAGGHVIVWPALSSAQSNDATKSALGRLKGEFDALVLTATQKNCGLKFQQAGA
jgi:hypothetical protein